jgi:hypothetical protein
MAPPRRSTGAGVRNARVLGIVLIVGGGVALGLGWAGMASKDCAQCQLPYIVSGGALGLALIVLGSVMFILAQMRVAQESFRDQIRQINQAVIRMAGLTGAGDNGGGQAVLAGSSTYHRPECRLVQGKSGLERMAAETAALQGLTPCRVCNPPRTPTSRFRAADELGPPARDPGTRYAPRYAVLSSS